MYNNNNKVYSFSYALLKTYPISIDCSTLDMSIHKKHKIITNKHLLVKCRNNFNHSLFHTFIFAKTQCYY